jgi:hypothetical protein
MFNAVNGVALIFSLAFKHRFLFMHKAVMRKAGAAQK